MFYDCVCLCVCACTSAHICILCTRQLGASSCSQRGETISSRLLEVDEMRLLCFRARTPTFLIPSKPTASIIQVGGRVGSSRHEGLSSHKPERVGDLQCRRTLLLRHSTHNTGTHRCDHTHTHTQTTTDLRERATCNARAHTFQVYLMQR